MLKGIKEQRTLVAFIFYILAMLLLIGECFIISERIAFPIIIATPIVYFIYYTLLSIVIDENKLWPLGVLFVMCVIIYGLSSDQTPLICEILEIALFIIEIITAFAVKFIRIHLKNNK